MLQTIAILTKIHPNGIPHSRPDSVVDGYSPLTEAIASGSCQRSGRHVHLLLRYVQNVHLYLPDAQQHLVTTLELHRL